MDFFGFVLMMAMTPVPNGSARPDVGAKHQAVPERKLHRFGSFIDVVQAEVVQADPGQAGPGVGQDKKTKTKSINFGRPTEGGSFKKVKDSANKYYLDSYGDITGFTQPYPFLMGTLYSADRKKQWFPVTKKSPMTTNPPEWQFWFYDMPFNEIPNEKEYYLLVQTMDPKPNDVSNGVSFTISESGSVLTRKIVGGTTDIEWPHPVVPMLRGRTQRSFGFMPIHLASEPLSADIFNRFTGARVPGTRIHQGVLGSWIMSFDLPADLAIRDDYTLRVYTSTMSTWGEVDKLKVR